MFLIGKQFDFPEIQKEIELLSYKVIKGENNKHKIEVEYKKIIPRRNIIINSFKLKINVEEYLRKKLIFQNYQFHVFLILIIFKKK